MFMPKKARHAACRIALAASCAIPAVSQAQDEPFTLPEIVVDGFGTGSLVSPGFQASRQVVQRTPGAVEVVDADSYRQTTPAATVKDALDYVPGVFAQPRWGTDTRLSIRGSSLSRNYGLRGVQMYLDGIPLNTADGFGDFGVVDPSAYRHIEVFKGANALRFGANSLGGAINFVTPTGYDSRLFGAGVDVGSFGFRKATVTSGNVAGNADYFASVTALEEDGFRDHGERDGIWGHANLGYRFSDRLETRFYFNASRSDQEMPGQVTRETALSNPRAAGGEETRNDWQRNIETVLLANKTTLAIDNDTSLEFGVFAAHRDVKHPIFRWIDYTALEFGGFSRLSGERAVMGYRNRFIVGANIHYGENDDDRFENVFGDKGALLTSNIDQSHNVSLYGENSFYFLPDVALVTGLQYLHAVRDRDNRGGTQADASGRSEFDALNPRIGLLWEVDPEWQVFANISRSVEVPSFGDDTAGGAPFTSQMQKSITYEIGTRGRRENYRWDVAVYRADIRDELQCLTVVSPFFTNQCATTNADRTVHQGLELGFGIDVLGIAGVDPRHELWLNAAYTFSDFFFDDDAVWGDNELPGAPRHYLRAELLYRHQSGLFVGPNIEWSPQAYFVDNANTLKTDTYVLFGAKLGYEGENFSAYIEGRNLADQVYISSASVSGDLNGVDGNYFNPGAGRAVYAGMKYRW